VHDVEVTANKLEATLLDVARRFGVELDIVDKPAAKSSPIR
jgi:hypothetical protein